MYCRSSRSVSAEALSRALGAGSPLASLRQGRLRHQREELRLLIERHEGNLAEVARHLGLSRSTVFYRARKFGLVDPRRP